MQAGSVSDVVGHTPLIKLQSLSQITGCEIFAKAEYLNPGGSVKDRTALGIILNVEKSGLLKPGYTIVEGTAGNTGIGLATLAAQRGYHCVIVMPDNQAKEKYDALQALGVELVKVPPCPFANPNHFYHTARTLAEARPNSFWANQFENTANFEIHFQTTGPEIWTQMDRRVDAFVSSVGTGGTLAGVSSYLKEQDAKIFTLLADPMGSGLYSFVKTGKFESQGSSITEGIGIMRLTENFKKARVDEAVQVTDEQMLSMLYYLAQHEGLLVGTSAALNIFAAYQYALQNQGQGLRIATVMGDSALRYQSKVFNPQFLSEKNLQVRPLIHS
ncbi:cysteine synthase A [Bdellovibrio bacteriovorus]|uniref:cysteine synthase A n=1 Tax=Bdellovibrio bacteriovorus TaxID=959 RepID=UPI0035A581B3